MILSQGDHSKIPVPVTFLFIPGMPVVVNQSTYQCLKLVNGASYTALRAILDKSYPGHGRHAAIVSQVTPILHFGPPGRNSFGASDDELFPFRRPATQHHPPDAHEHQNNVPEEAAVATQQR